MSDSAESGLQRSALRISSSILSLQRRAEQELLDTQRALLQQADALASSNALLHTTLESSPAGILAVDRDGRITAYNTKIAVMWSIPPEIQEGRDFAEWCSVMAAESRHRILAIARFRRVAQALSEVHGTLEMLDGRTLEYSSAPHLQDGHNTGVVLHCRDITDRRRALAEQEALQEQLRESQKMESIGSLAGGIAHDFNNILGAILGNTVLASHSVPPEHPAAESLAAIQSAAERATRLVQQILTFSRRQRQQVQRVSLGALLTEAAGLLRATIPTGIEIVMEIDPHAPPVHGDPTQILQVMMNLGTNAMRAVHERTGNDGGTGRITLRTRTERVSDRQVPGRPPGLPSGSHVVLVVTDDGVGMDASTRERMFEPFFTTRRIGTGLGLSVVHGILAAHEGGIAVETTPGVGTTISAYFPVASEDEALATDGLSPSETTRDPVIATRAQVRDGAERKHVIVIDDESMLVSIATRILTSAGYRVTGFTDAVAALAALRQDVASVDVLITDFNMPKVSGLEIAQAVRDLRDDLPILISSGFLTQELEAQAALARVQVIEKTSLVTTLARVVAGMVRKEV